jgi:hypothetical protein
MDANFADTILDKPGFYDIMLQSLLLERVTILQILFSSVEFEFVSFFIYLSYDEHM